eukprot:g1297.t1
MAEKEEDGIVASNAAAERRREEREYVEQRLEEGKGKIKEILESKKGIAALKAETKKQRALRKARNQALKGLSKEAQKEQKLKNTFEMYDLDGTNTIDFEEFGEMLKDLCVPTDDKQTRRAYQDILRVGSLYRDDINSRGNAHDEIHYDDFKRWFESKGQHLGKRNRLAQFRLKAAKRASTASGQIDQIRARRVLVQAALQQLRTKAMAEYRRTRPPSSDEIDDAGTRTATDELLPRDHETVRKATVEAERLYNEELKTLEVEGMDKLDKNNDRVVDEAELAGALLDKTMSSSALENYASAVENDSKLNTTSGLEETESTANLLAGSSEAREKFRREASILAKDIASGNDEEKKSSDEDIKAKDAAFAERLKRYYLTHNPDKLSDISGLIEKYRGYEEVVFKRLVQKYGPEPPTPAPRRSRTKRRKSKEPTDAASAEILKAPPRVPTPPNLGPPTTMKADNGGDISTDGDDDDDIPSPPGLRTDTTSGAAREIEKADEDDESAPSASLHHVHGDEDEDDANIPPPPGLPFGADETVGAKSGPLSVNGTKNEEEDAIDEDVPPPPGLPLGTGGAMIGATFGHDDDAPHPPLPDDDEHLEDERNADRNADDASSHLVDAIAKEVERIEKAASKIEDDDVVASDEVGTKPPSPRSARRASNFQILPASPSEKSVVLEGVKTIHGRTFSGETFRGEIEADVSSPMPSPAVVSTKRVVRETKFIKAVVSRDDEGEDEEGGEECEAPPGFVSPGEIAYRGEVSAKENDGGVNGSRSSGSTKAAVATTPSEKLTSAAPPGLGDDGDHFERVDATTSIPNVFVLSEDRRVVTDTDEKKGESDIDEDVVVSSSALPASSFDVGTTTMFDKIFYLDREGSPQGPISPATFVRFATDYTFFWFEGRARWTKVEDAPQIRAFLQENQYFMAVRSAVDEKPSALGPFCLEELKAHPGFDRDATPIWRYGMSQWEALSKLR